MTGQQLFDILYAHKGEPYVLGSIAPKDVTTYRGPWDCAEFISWGVYQLTGRLYGCANNFGNPHTADSYTGFWGRDAVQLGRKITINEAYATPGAALLRVAANGVVGHIVCSNGHGGTIEAHSHKDGVISSVITGRRWDYGILVPWIEYSINDIDPVNDKPVGTIYRLTKPYMRGEMVKRIQFALGIHVDGKYGPETYNSVKGFQNKHGLVADGEVGAKTLAALGINI